MPARSQASAAEAKLVVKPTRRRSLPQEIVDQLLELIAAQGTSELALPSERVRVRSRCQPNVSSRGAVGAEPLGYSRSAGRLSSGACSRTRTTRRRQAANESQRELVTDPIEVRRMLEPEVAAKAAERASDRALDEIEKWLDLMEASAREGGHIISMTPRFTCPSPARPGITC